MIQNLIVALIVFACASYIIWKFALNRKRNICQGCDKCCNKQKQGSCH